ncbi:MAG: 2-dehydro-3-deoxygalactonokinase [Rhizobiaceae bacterium]|nr:2-dehydro-3-deoxygalactonokinase [Rhizobiaceae bacterium]
MVDTILIDWGTTNFRLWHVDGDQSVVGEYRSEMGMSKLKPNEYEPLVENTLRSLDVSSQTPVLICGMAGAAQGWRDAGYIDAPCRIGDLSSKSVRLETESGRDIRILPGIAQRNVSHPNVMRGEETLLAGAVSSGLEFDVFCLPGTHSKWVFMKGVQVQSFKTFMTGELFSVLKNAPTLSHFFNADVSSDLDMSVFTENVLAAVRNPNIFHESIFSLRAGPLLRGETTHVELQSKLSGLLVGSEISAMKEVCNNCVGLIADGINGKLYQAAFEASGIQYQLASSEALALAGLTSAAQKIWGDE